MRFLAIAIAIFFMACGQVFDASSTTTGIIGTWKFIGMSKKQINIDELTGSSSLMGGQLTFNSDNSFTGEVTYPSSPEKNVKVFGTYSFENGIATINNTANNSTTRSRVEFERDFMVFVPLDPGVPVAYYKREN